MYMQRIAINCMLIMLALTPILTMDIALKDMDEWTPSTPAIERNRQMRIKTLALVALSVNGITGHQNNDTNGRERLLQVINRINLANKKNNIMV